MAGTRLPKYLSSGVLLIGLGLLPLQLFTDSILAKAVPTVVIVSAVAFLISDRQGRSGISHLSSSFQKPLFTLAFFLVAIAIVLGLTFASRPWFVKVLFGLSGSMLLIWVIFAREVNHYLALVSIISISVLYQLTTTALAPSLIGIDIQTHIELARSIQSGGFSTIASNKHFGAPIYHLLLVTTSTILGICLRWSAVATATIVLPVGAVLIDLAARRIAPERVALTAAALFAFSHHVVKWSVHPIPTTIGAFFFLFVFHFSLDRAPKGKRRWILPIFGGLVIVTHQVSTFVMLIFLGASLIIRMGSIAVNNRGKLPVIIDNRPLTDISLLFGVVAGASWTLATPYGSSTFLPVSVYVLLTSLIQDSMVVGPAPAPDVELWLSVLDIIGFLAFFGMAIFGGLSIFTKDNLYLRGLIIAGSAATLLFFAMGLPLFGIDNFVPGRWYIFAFAPMAILAALAIDRLSKSSGKVVQVIVVFLVITSVMGMAVSNIASPDNPTVGELRNNPVYTDEEQLASEQIGLYLPNNVVVITDYTYQSFIIRNGHYSDVRVYGESTSNYSIYRSAQSESFVMVHTESGVPYLAQIPKEDICSPSSSETFTTGNVTLCIS